MGRSFGTKSSSSLERGRKDHVYDELFEADVHDHKAEKSLSDGEVGDLYHILGIKLVELCKNSGW